MAGETRRAGGSPYKTRHPKRRAFLAAYAESGNVTRAAEIAEVNRSMHYDWLAADPLYAEDFRAAEDQAGDRLEQEARRRAVEGVAEPIYYQGVRVGAVQKYSDTLLIFLLKGARPEKYKDRAAHEHTGAHGGPIAIEDPRERLADLIARHAAAGATGDVAGEPDPGAGEGVPL